MGRRESARGAGATRQGSAGEQPTSAGGATAWSGDTARAAVRDRRERRAGARGEGTAARCGSGKLAAGGLQARLLTLPRRPAPHPSPSTTLVTTKAEFLPLIGLIRAQIINKREFLPHI
ncbi:hypothetical protein PSAB_07610 [Paenibacillus sabinae T27]|uniref:Uncharacterized protein n=1 Tax=Paenibacillus sabinae T27 TaxID=1268072 RepID=X4ZXP0_9BACL|nr:hypothetical protein PSAB_07610 [Paenibacillus sabinae T27]